jgi:hypothetical protein
MDAFITLYRFIRFAYHYLYSILATVALAQGKYTGVLIILTCWLGVHLIRRIIDQRLGE